MNSSPLDRVSLKNPVHLLALGFGSGLIRPAPGTWGSLAGTILGSALLACLGLKIFLILLATIPTLSLPWIVIAFVLFRFFDILKPYPIRYFDQKLESGFGIMVDDVLAAIYAVIVIVILRIVGLSC